MSLVEPEGVQGPMLGLWAPGMAKHRHRPGVRHITFWHALTQ